MMRLPSETIEQTLLEKGIDHIIGVDEVGMGCLAGPVVVCAVAISKNIYKSGVLNGLGIRDSKALSSKQRETCSLKLKEIGVSYRIAYCYPRTIDKINIYQASRKAMRRSIKYLVVSSERRSPKLDTNYSLLNTLVLIDGPHKIPGLELPQQAIIKGDQKVFAIACASIIAKVFRDHMMMRYAKRYPEYAFEKHKGYGTTLHYAMLSVHGPSKLHRKSFTLSPEKATIGI